MFHWMLTLCAKTNACHEWNWTIFRKYVDYILQVVVFVIEFF